MENLITMSGAVGALLPLLVAVVNRSVWPGWAKGLVVVASSLAAGAFTAYYAGEFTGKTWVQSALTIGTAAVLAYKTFWQPTGIGPAIERATEPKGSTE